MIKRMIADIPVWGTKQFWEEFDKLEKEYLQNYYTQNELRTK